MLLHAACNNHLIIITNKDVTECWNGAVPTVSASAMQSTATTSPTVTTAPTKSTALLKVALLPFSVFFYVGDFLFSSYLYASVF